MTSESAKKCRIMTEMQRQMLWQDHATQFYAKVPATAKLHRKLKTVFVF